MAAKRPDFLPLLRVDVTAEDHQCLDGFGHERRRLVDVGKRVGPGAGGLGATAAGRIHLGLDDAGVAVVDGAKDRYGASVTARVADEQLPRSRSLRGRVGHAPWAAFWAACATVSLSANPLILATSVPGRV